MVKEDILWESVHCIIARSVV